MVTLLTPAQAAERTGLSRSTLAKLRVRGGGPRFRKLGARVLYPESEVDEWVGAQPLRRSTSEYVPQERRRTGRPRRLERSESAP